MRVLRTLRALLAVPATDFAKDAGITRQELHRIEDGSVHPPAKTIAALDDAMDRVLQRRLKRRSGT